MISYESALNHAVPTEGCGKILKSNNCTFFAFLFVSVPFKSRQVLKVATFKNLLHYLQFLDFLSLLRDETSISVLNERSLYTSNGTDFVSKYTGFV